jgi:hypothetical protein
VTHSRRKYADEGLVYSLQSRIAVLESVVRRYREADQPEKSNGNKVLERTRRSIEEEQDREPSSSGHVTDVSDWHPSLCSSEYMGASPRKSTKDVDGRSQFAMEDLASLMLTMDVNGQREPSFMMTSSSQKASIIGGQGIRAEYSIDITESGEETLIHQTLNLPIQIRQQLMFFFMENFNIFHQYLDFDDSIFAVSSDHNFGNPDLRFRNYALFSIGGYFSDTPDLQYIGRMCASKAESMALNCMRNNTSDLLVQGLSLLAWRELTLGNDDMAYNYIGQSAIQGLPFCFPLTESVSSNGHWSDPSPGSSCCGSV